MTPVAVHFSIWMALLGYLYLEMNMATVTSVCYIQVPHTHFWKGGHLCLCNF